MLETTPSGEPARRPDAVGRGVLLIVLTGALLGIAFNQLGQKSRPPRGLPWIAEPKTLASLEDLGKTGPAAAPAASPAPASPSADLNDPLAGAVAADSGPGLPEIPDLDQPLKVQAETVKKFFEAKGALIIDARDADEYAEGHIPGSLNLPYNQVASDPERLSKVDPNGRPIIVYCGGGTCEASMHLAESLIYQAGRRKVLVYEGGWPDWKQKGFPIEKGKQG